MPEATAQVSKEELRGRILELGRGEAPALKAAEALTGALEFEKVKEASKPKGMAEDIKNIGRRSRMEKIDGSLFKLDAIRMAMQIKMGVEKASSEMHTLAHAAESTFFTKQGTNRSVVERLQEDLCDIFEIKRLK
jgi:endo-1,4-beta-D-glucanase Y